jgi:hypothetical protein
MSFTPLKMFASAVVLVGIIIITYVLWNMFVIVPAPSAPAPGPAATTTSATTTASAPSKPVSHPGEVKLVAYTTAYTYFDNTPPGSSIIAFPKSDGFPTLHEVAGGTGTYSDPITVAVGHVMSGGVDTPDFAPGTRFYLPNLRRYFMVEDTCGDGDHPQDIPCHKLNDEAASTGATVWLDLWIGGDANSSEAEAAACASEVTGGHLILLKPAAHYAVSAGPVLSGMVCGTQYGDTLVTL